jgi:hypothetical protein
MFHTGYKEMYRAHSKYKILWFTNSKPHKLEEPWWVKCKIEPYSGACYAIRLMVHISNINTLKPIYYAYLHSTTKYRIIFGG